MISSILQNLSLRGDISNLSDVDVSKEAGTIKGELRGSVVSGIGRVVVRL